MRPCQNWISNAKSKLYKTKVHGLDSINNICCFTCLEWKTLEEKHSSNGYGVGTRKINIGWHAKSGGGGGSLNK